MNSIKSKKEIAFLPLVERFIQDSKSGRRLQPNGKRITKGCIRNYEQCLRLLRNFSETKQFDLRIRPAVSLTGRQTVTEKNYWKKFYQRFTDYLFNECGHFDNYVGANMKLIRVFFHYAQHELQIDTGLFYKQFYALKEDIPVITLLPEELNFLIYNQTFEQSLSPFMQRVKDVFVFGCTVALRYSDLMKLKQTNLRIHGDQWSLVVRSQKTATDTVIKLPDYAIAILQRYKKRKAGLLPFFSGSNFNKYVKRLAEQAGFVQPMDKYRSRRGVPVKIQTGSSTRFCDLVSTHTMRRSAITVMLSLGMPEQVVRKISGHAPGSKEFYRYVAIAQTYLDKETEIMHQKMKALSVKAEELVRA